MAIVYANSTGGVGDPSRPGVIVRTVKGEPWDADDPFVKARPEMFTAEPPFVRRTTERKAPSTARVEQATAAPGEVRQTKRGPGRPRKSS